jgi:polygalacturonase
MFAALAGAGAFGAASEARAAPLREAAPRAELDAGALGLRPNAPDDQSQIFQRAIEQAAAARAVLRLPPGFYRAGGL